MRISNRNMISTPPGTIGICARHLHRAMLHVETVISHESTLIALFLVPTADFLEGRDCESARLAIGDRRFGIAIDSLEKSYQGKPQMRGLLFLCDFIPVAAKLDRQFVGPSVNMVDKSP